MGLYTSRVFPWLVDTFMSRDSFFVIRRNLLSQVTGNTLEIGFGTGLNLRHYPPSLRQLSILDANPGMLRRAARRIDASLVRLDVHVSNGSVLPFPTGVFDSVVSTWTLCSILNIQALLGEVHRVLKPGGQFFFAEHGLSNDVRVRKWQRRLTPVQKKIADGCHLDRDIPTLLRDADFRLDRLECFDMKGLPKVASHMFVGVGIRRSTTT